MLTPWKKSYPNPDSILKNRHHYANKDPYTKDMVFPVVMWKLDQKEGWAWKNLPFKLWCWRRLFRVSWTARRSNQSILQEINPEYSLEGLILKLKFQYFGHLMQTADSLEKALMLGKTEGKKRRGWQRTGWLDGIISSVDMSLSKLLQTVEDREAWHAAIHRVTGLNNNMPLGTLWYKLSGLHTFPILARV